MKPEELDFTVKEGCEVYTKEFWYDLAYGGSLKPEEILKDEKTVAEVYNAVRILQAFYEACKDQIEGFAQ